MLLVFAYGANRVRKYGVPIRTSAPPLDWTNIDDKPAQPQWAQLEENTNRENAPDPEAPSGQAPRDAT